MRCSPASTPSTPRRRSAWRCSTRPWPRASATSTAPRSHGRAASIRSGARTTSTSTPGASCTSTARSAAAREPRLAATHHRARRARRLRPGGPSLPEVRRCDRDAPASASRRAASGGARAVSDEPATRGRCAAHPGPWQTARMQMRATGRTWAVATPHTLATDAAAIAFERGGNALDAALAAATTLAVVYPHMCGVGGDLFALVQHPAGDVVAINASGRAPAGADPERARRPPAPGVMPEHGPLSVTVPGAVSGWEALHRQGANLTWADAFTAADRLRARRRAGRSVARRDDRGGGDPAACRPRPRRRCSIPDGEPAAVRTPVRQPTLGATLQAIAEHGAQVWYGGEVGTRYARGPGRARRADRPRRHGRTSRRSRHPVARPLRRRRRARASTELPRVRAPRGALGRRPPRPRSRPARARRRRARRTCSGPRRAIATATSPMPTACACTPRPCSTTDTSAPWPTRCGRACPGRRPVSSTGRATRSPS